MSKGASIFLWIVGTVLLLLTELIHDEIRATAAASSGVVLGMIGIATLLFPQEDK